MLKKSHVLMKAAVFCLWISLLVAPGRSQGRGPGQAPAQGQRGGRGQTALPDGPGKEQVQMQCAKCHALGLITNAGGNTRQEWVDLFSTMVKLSNDQRDAIAEYLANSFPPQPRPQPMVIPGPMNVS